MTHPTDIHEEWSALIAQYPACSQLDAARQVGSNVYGWERCVRCYTTDGTSWAELLRVARRNGTIKVTWADQLPASEQRRLQERWQERWLIVECIVCGMSPEYTLDALYAMMRRRGLDPVDELQRMGQAIVDAHLCEAMDSGRLSDDEYRQAAEIVGVKA